MKRFENAFDLIVDFVEKFVFIIAATLIIIVSTVVSAELISRNLGHSFIIVEELSMILLGWISFFSAAYAFRKRAHVVVDFIYAKFGTKTKVVLYTVTYIFALVFMVYIIDASIKIAVIQMNIPMTLSGLPRGLIYWGLPIGGCFIVFFIITDLIESLILKRKESLLTEEEKYTQDIEDSKDNQEVKEFLEKFESNGSDKLNIESANISNEQLKDGGKND